MFAHCRARNPSRQPINPCSNNNRHYVCFILQLILKLTLSMIVSTDKSPDVRCDNELKLSEDVNDDEATPNQDATRKPECPRTTTLSDTAVQTEPEPEPEFFDCREPTEPQPTQTKTCRFLESSSIQRRLERRPPPSRLVAATFYGCVLCCVAQLSALVYMLSGDAVRFPPGLIFLILALAYIGFVMTRVSQNIGLFSSFASADSSRRRDDAAAICFSLLRVYFFCFVPLGNSIYLKTWVQCSNCEGEC